MYQGLLMLQTELEGPAYAFNQMLGQMGSHAHNMMVNPYGMQSQSPVSNN